MGEQTDQGDVSAAGRRIFADAVQRRKHAGMDIDIVAIAVDIHVNAGHLVPRQMLFEYFGMGPCRSQRRSRVELGKDEGRTAAGNQWLVALRLDMIER